MRNIAIFISGSGTNMVNLAEATQDGRLPNVQIQFVFSDKKEALGFKKAEELGLKVVSREIKDFASKESYELEILSLLKDAEVEFIVLAGYMKIIGKTLLEAYQERIINIHPAYLPEFPGAHGIQDAFEAKVKETGVTVHYVDAGIDTGPIILQERVPVFENESLEELEKRVHEKEYDLYPRALKIALNGV